MIDRKPDLNNPDTTTDKTIRQNMQSPENLGITNMLDARAPSVLAAAEKSAQERAAAIEAEHTAQRDTAMEQQRQAGVRKDIISLAQGPDAKITHDGDVILIENGDEKLMLEKKADGTMDITHSKDGIVNTENFSPAQTAKTHDGLKKFLGDGKGVAANIAIAAVASVAALTYGATYAEAAQAGASTIAPYSTKTLMSENSTVSDYIDAAFSDVVASVAPETVGTYKKGGDALDYTKSVSKDVAVGSSFVLGCEAFGGLVSPSVVTGVPGAVLTGAACFVGGIATATTVSKGLNAAENSFNESFQKIPAPLDTPLDLGAYTTIVRNIPQGEPIVNFDRGDITVSGERMSNVFDKSSNPANENIERINARELENSVVFQPVEQRQQSHMFTVQ